MSTTWVSFLVSDQFSLYWVIFTASFFLWKSFEAIVQCQLLRGELKSARDAFAAAPDSLDQNAFEKLQATLGCLRKTEVIWRQFKGKLLSTYSPASRQTRLALAEYPQNFLSAERLRSLISLKAWQTSVVLTGLGVLGTFVGLAAGIYLARKGFGSNRLDLMQASMNQLLSGAGHAFITSVCGLSCSLAFSKIEHGLYLSLHRSASALLREIEARLPVIHPNALLAQTAATSEDQAETMRLMLQEMKRLADHRIEVGDRVLNHHVHTFAQTLTSLFAKESLHTAEVFAQFNAATKQAITQFSELTSTAHRQTAELNRASGQAASNALLATKEMAASVAELRSTLTKDWGTASNQEMIGLMRGLQDGVRQLAASQERTKSSAPFEGEHPQVNEFAVSMKQQTAKLRDLNVLMEQGLFNMERAISDNLNKLHNGISIALERMSELNQENNATLRRGVDGLNNAVGHMKELSGSKLLRNRYDL